MKKIARRGIGCLILVLAGLAILNFLIAPKISENHRRHIAHEFAAMLLHEAGAVTDLEEVTSFPFLAAQTTRAEVSHVADEHGYKWQVPQGPGIAFFRLRAERHQGFAAYLAQRIDSQEVIWVEVADSKITPNLITPNESRLDNPLPAPSRDGPRDQNP